jgi:hybrid cluster-associated redox disulfide protein
MSDNNMITGDMRIEEIVAKYPQTIGIFFQYGLGCVGCHAASFESLAEGAMMHGIDLDAMLQELNELVSKVQAKKEP